MTAFTDEEKKLAELVLYVSHKCMTHSKFGATKLNKILFFSDFMYFKLYGKPITGVEYFKLQNGPAPKCLMKVRENLRESKDLVVVPRITAGGFVQHRTIPLRQPNLEEFTASQIAIVDEVIELLKDKSAEEVSDLSHYYVIGWKLYDLKEEIPYHSVFARPMKKEYITDADIRRANEVAEKHGLASTSEAKRSRDSS